MKLFYTLSFLLCIGLFHSKAQNLYDGEFHRENNLVWSQIDKSFYNGAFIGDGVQGAMIMQDNVDADAVRMLLGHYQAIAHQSISGWEYTNSRVYAGNIIINPVGTANKQTMLLDIFNGKATGEIGTNEGSIKWSAISDRKNLVFAVKIETTGNEGNANLGVREEWGISPKFYLDKKDPNTYASQLPPLPTKETSGDIDLVINKMRLRGAHVVASKIEELDASTKILYVAIGVSDNNSVDVAANNAKADAIARINAAVAEGYETIHTRNTTWWNTYMNKGTLAINEDPYWQKFWWLQIYKFGCASSETSSYLIDTQGPWIWETAWAGVWWNLNIQLSYFPIFSSNRLDAGKSLINGMNRLYNSGALSANAGGNGIYIARSSTYEGKATWGDELGNLPWILHCYYKYWKYSGDDAIGLALFPMLKDNMKYLSSKLTKDAEGKYHVSASRSPEYDDAVLYVDANYSLMSIDWLLRALLEMNTTLNINDSESANWQEKLDNLMPLPANDNGYMIAPTQGFDKGHRHYSHLMSIYPYHTITTDNDPTNLIGRSLDRWLSLTEVSGNAGYTYTGGCAMRALQGNGNEALRLLEKLKTDKVQPNSMYAEGGGPVIETPLSGVESINYLVLQSFGGIIKVFPAVPSKWKNVSFSDFRTEGAFLVSAEMVNGQFDSFTVLSEKGKPCTIRNPWVGKTLRVVDESGQDVALSNSGNDYTFPTTSGKKYRVEQLKNPLVVKASVINLATELVVNFDSKLNVAEPITGFSLVDGNSAPVAISAIALLDGAKSVKFTLQNAISADTDLKLSYTNGNVKSVYDLNLDNFSALRVDNLLAGSSPVLVSATVEGNSVLLGFNKNLMEVTANGFSIKVLPDVNVDINQLLWSDQKANTIKLVLTNELYSSQTVELSYSGNSIRSTDNGELRPITAFQLTNLCVGTPPLVESATAPISGNVVDLVFNKNMSEVAQEILFFELKANGVNVPISKVSVSGKTISLSTAVLVQSGQVLSLSYLNGGNIVATDGGKLAYFTNTPVTNNAISKYIYDFSINSTYPNYTIDISETGKVVYNDRAFAFSTLPASINKVEYIRWSNTMKNLSVNASFKTSADGRVYIAHDNRLQKPDWLKNEYTVTSDQFLINDAMMTLYYKEVKSNTLVQVGSNQIPGTETGSCTNYVVFFRKETIASNVEFGNQDAITIFPVPANDYINISMGQILSGNAEVYSVSGRLMFYGNIDDDVCRIPVSNWEQGIYLVKIILSDRTVTRKVIVAH